MHTGLLMVDQQMKSDSETKCPDQTSSTAYISTKIPLTKAVRQNYCLIYHCWCCQDIVTCTKVSFILHKILTKQNRKIMWRQQVFHAVQCTRYTFWQLQQLSVVSFFIDMHFFFIIAITLKLFPPRYYVATYPLVVNTKQFKKSLCCKCYFYKLIFTRIFHCFPF